MKLSAPACLVFIFVSVTAGAQSDRPAIRSEAGDGVRGQGWSVNGGATIGEGNNAFTAEAGFPGVSLSYLRGSSDRVDVGLHVTFNYSEEGLLRVVGVPGLKFQGVARLKLLDTGRVNIGLRVEPGVFVYFWPVFPNVAVILPVDLRIGLPITDALTVVAGLDVPLFLTFGQFSSFNAQLLFGGGIEYFINRSLALTLNIRMGPWLNSKTAHAEFALESLLGVAFRL